MKGKKDKKIDDALSVEVRKNEGKKEKIIMKRKREREKR